MGARDPRGWLQGLTRMGSGVSAWTKLGTVRTALVLAISGTPLMFSACGSGDDGSDPAVGGNSGATAGTTTTTGAAVGTGAATSGTTTTGAAASSGATTGGFNEDCGGAPLAFPGAQGFGRCSEGGRGGPVIDVTTLNDSGPASLRECVEVTSGPRTCRVAVNGTAELLKDITIRHDNVTIDGSAGRLAIKNGGIVVRANHTIIRHLRIRPGAKLWLQNGTNANAITYMSREDGSGTWQHIADHVSVSWTTDDSIAVINGTQNVTIQDSIISEGLDSGPGCNNCSSKGILVGTGNKETLSVLRTLSAHTFLRFPNASAGQIDWVNNVDYNSSGVTSQVVPFYNPVHINFVGNTYKDGLSSAAFKEGVNLTYRVIRTMGSFTYSAQSGIYVEDNVGRFCAPGDAPTCIIWGDNGGIAVQPQRYPHPQMSTLPAAAAYDMVLDNSGAQPRDAVDTRVVNDVKNGTGKWISDPLTVGGWPAL